MNLKEKLSQIWIWIKSNPKWIITTIIALIFGGITLHSAINYHNRMETSNRITQLSVLAEECNATEEIKQIKQARMEIAKDNITGAENIASNVIKSLERINCPTGMMVVVSPSIILLNVIVIIIIVISMYFLIKLKSYSFANTSVK